MSLICFLLIYSFEIPMSSLAKEFYEDGSKKLSSTPYDLDSYNTGVGLKSIHCQM